MASDSTTTNNNKVLVVFENEEDLAAALAKYTANLSGKFAAERGAFNVIISGVSLVKALRSIQKIVFFTLILKFKKLSF
jgi:6-phosphogluconolactonase